MCIILALMALGRHFFVRAGVVLSGSGKVGSPYICRNYWFRGLE